MTLGQLMKWACRLALVCLALTTLSVSGMKDALDLADADARAKCNEERRREADEGMCDAKRLHTHALEVALRHTVFPEWGDYPFCNAHGNRRIWGVRGFEGEEPEFVQSCCVQACLLEVKQLNFEYSIAYFLSGARDKDLLDPKDIYEDSKCEDCWGTFTIRRKSKDISNGPLCKRGESWLLWFAPLKANDKKEIETRKRNLWDMINVEKLPWCTDVDFKSANGSKVTVPPEITKKVSVNVCPKASNTGSKAPDCEPTAPDTNNGDQNCNDSKSSGHFWLWLGPVLALVGTALLGICGIIASKCQRGVVIKTSQQTSSSDTSLDVWEKKNTEIVELGS